MTSNPPEYDALAKRYLDLWQHEMTKMAQDPTAAGAWANLFQGMMQNAAAMTSGMTSGLNNGFTSTSHATRDTPNASPGAAPVATSFGDGGLAAADVLRRIDARLGEIEQRLAALEAHPPARRRTRAPKS